LVIPSVVLRELVELAVKGAPRGIAGVYSVLYDSIKLQINL